MKNKSSFVLLVTCVLALASCATSNHARIGNRGTDVLAVQSEFENKHTNPAIETAQPVEMASAAILTSNELGNESDEKQMVMQPQAGSAIPAPTRKSVRAEIQQLSREQKKEIRKTILYAYTGKELPQSENAQKDGAPFIDQTAAAIIAFFIPPLGAGLYFGKDKRTWISLGLFLLLWLPGAIYAMIMILRD